MDVTYTNVLESTRQYFQGLPTPGGSSQNPAFPHSSYWAFQQKQFRTPAEPAAQSLSHTTEQQSSHTNRLPTLAPFSTLNFRGGTNGSLPTLPKSSQAAFEGQIVPPRYPSPSGYPNYFQQQQQAITKELIQNHQGQQQQNHHQQILNHQQQQQQEQQHQLQQHHQIHQQLLQEQQHIHQQHKQQQSSIIQNHQSQQSVSNSQSLHHSIHIQKSAIQSHTNNLITRQPTSQSQHHVILNHSGHQQQQGQNQSHQHSSYQNHESHHQKHHGQQSQHVLQNQQIQSKLHHGQKQQLFQDHSQGILQNLRSLQTNQSQNQASHFQNHHLLSKYSTHSLKNQQILQNHIQNSQQQNVQNHLQNHISNLTRQSPLMSPPQQGVTRQSPHVSHHQSNHSATSPCLSSHSPQLFNHQQGITRHSPLINHHQSLTRQSPHLSSHHPPSISPHVQSHAQGLTRQSPHIANHHPSSISSQIPPHPQVVTSHIANHQTSLTSSSPHLSHNHVLHPQQSSSCQLVAHHGHQQTAFSPSSAVSITGGATTAHIGVGSSNSLLSEVKRESPLDLSVKTIRQSADSTADSSASSSENVYYTFHNDYLRSKPSVSGHSQPICAPKVEFPSFTSSLSQEKKKKESLYSLPPVNSFNRSLDKLYAQHRQHQQLHPPQPLHQQQPTQLQPQQQTIQLQQQQQRLSFPIDSRYPHNYQKRPLEPEKQSLPASKMPKLELDEWKISMDKMIEKKLAADERHSHWQEKLNVENKKSSLPAPAVGGNDKRGVLSILRSSLETKEAKNQQVQMQQKATAPRYTESRLPAGTVVRQNLPPFGALTGGTSGLTPGRLHFPRAVDSIHHPEIPSTRLDVVDITDDDDDVAPPTVPVTTQSKGDLDGLAAFLASRIRTKAELKQQLTPNSKENSRISTNSNSSNHTSPRCTPSFMSPHINNKDLVRNLTSPDGMSAGVSKPLPWNHSSIKLYKESHSQASTPRRS